MKRLLLLLLLASPVMAQTTAVTGTIVDPQGNPYASGTVSAIKSVATGQNPGTPVAGTTSIVGTFSITLPSPASYIFTVCAAPTQIGPTGNPTPVQVCFSNPIPIAISGGSQDVSSSLNAVAKVLGPNITGVSGVVSTCTANQVPFYAVNGNVVACSSVITISGSTATVQNETVIGNETVTGTNTVGVLSVGTTATITGALAANGGATVNGGITVNGGSALNGGGSDSGAWTHSGNHTFNGATMAVNSNATFNSQTTITNPCIIDGGIWVSASGCYTSLATAFAACPLALVNCTIYMQGASGATNLGTFDPGNLSVTIYLGPFTYSLTQMTVRSGLHLIGMGSNITIINQANAGTAPFVLPTGGTYPANVAIHVLFKGFNLQAAPSSTTDGFSMVATQDITGKGGGIWYSRWEDINIGSTSTFGRNPIRLDTTTNLTASLTGANQFLSFQDVFAFRAKNAPPVVLITGSFSGQISFNNCQFDGAQGQLDTNANTYNIRIDDGGTAFVPYTVSMMQVTSQWAWGVGSAAIFVGGVQGFNCENCHFENDNGVIKEAVGAGGHGNWGIAIHEAYMTANVGVNAGNGFIADLGTQSGLDFSSNLYFGTPDAVFLGTLTYLNAGPNWNANSGAMEPWTQINLGLGVTVAGLPAVAANAGKQIYVTDSTAIAAEGQTCVGGGAVKALAFSNGTVWKCF